MLSQGAKVAAMLFDGWSDLSKQFHEVVLNDAHDMEAIGDDASAREVALDECTIRRTQIDADHAHLFPTV